MSDPLSATWEAIAKRGLQREWVERTVADPDWTDSDPRWPDRRRAFKAIAEFAGRILRVVYWPEGPDIVVLTIFPDRNAVNPGGRDDQDKL